MAELKIYPLYAKTDGSVISLGDVRSYDDEAAVVTAARHIREHAELGTIGANDVVWMMGPGDRVVIKPVQVQAAPEPSPARPERIRLRPRNSPPFCGCEVCGAWRGVMLEHLPARQVGWPPQGHAPARRFEAVGTDPIMLA